MAQSGTPADLDQGRRGLVRSIVLNAAVPLALYLLAKRYITDSEFDALAISSLVPLVFSGAEFVRRRRLDLIGILVLLGIAVSMVGIALGGDPKILLIRESFLTAALGVACFVSLFLPRPLMFYFGRQLSTGDDPVKVAAFNALWAIPAARHVFHRMTVVWGVVYCGEFLLRVVMVYTLPTAVVLAVSPIILGVLTFLTIAWTFAYARRSRQRGQTSGVVAPDSPPEAKTGLT
jgi:hypothetical protein